MKEYATMTYNLVRGNDPILREEIEKFDFTNPPTDPIQLAHDLAEVMIREGGIGLSANQLGLRYRVFAIKAEKVIVCFNPTIVDFSQEQIALEEGCLSYPFLFVKIKRPRRIKVRYTEPNGNVVTTTFDGLTSRVFQHELDHLNGVVFTSLASTINHDRARQKQKKLLRQNKKLISAEPVERLAIL